MFSPRFSLILSVFQPHRVYQGPTHLPKLIGATPILFHHGACRRGSSGDEGGLQIDVGKTDGRQTKARGKGAKVTKAVDVSWKPWDIVWAKISGFNYWPAKVQYIAFLD